MVGVIERERSCQARRNLKEHRWFLSFLCHCRPPPSTPKSTLSPFYLVESTANSRDGIPGPTDIPRKVRDLLGMHNFRMLLGHFPGAALKNSCFSGSAEFSEGLSPPPLKGFLMDCKVEINTEKASVTRDIISATSPFRF